MNNNKIKIFIFLLIPAFAFFSFPTASSAAECAAFPKLSFWGDLSHDNVRRQVENKFDGDWEAYVDKLTYIKLGLQKIHDRGKGAVIKLKGREITLKGKKLRNYLLLSGTRIKIARCLADEMEIADLQNFATAAGGNDPVETAQDSEDARTFVILPARLMVKLRKLAVRRSMVENQMVSVSDIITRKLRDEFKRTGE